MRRISLLTLAGLFGAALLATPAEACHRKNRCGGGGHRGGGWGHRGGGGHGGKYVTYDGSQWGTYPAGYGAPAPQSYGQPQYMGPAGASYTPGMPAPSGTMAPPPPMFGS